MTGKEKVVQLQALIADALLPEIQGRRVVLLEVPYYDNIGDTLIWQGTHDFLRRHGVKCLFTSSLDSFQFPLLPHDVVILLQGGGNFGDIWPLPQKFREKVVEHYPDNKIVILPQTVFFYDPEKMKASAAVLGRHSNLLIFARDHNSLQLLNKHFSANRIALMPDMAFCINLRKFKIPVPKENRTLFFERNDTEINSSIQYAEIVPADADRHDWPFRERQDVSWRTSMANRIRYRCFRYYDRYWDSVMRPYYVRTGIRFIGAYSKVYTTRLHGAILSLLLDKDIVFFNNSYGKNLNFYRSWLSDVDNVKFIDA